MTWLDRWSRRGLGREGAERVSAGCYGSIVAASTLAGSAAVPPGELALLVVATNLVYFSTHVFAYSIGDPNVEGKHLPQVAAHHARVAAPGLVQLPGELRALRRGRFPARRGGPSPGGLSRSSSFIHQR